MKRALSPRVWFLLAAAIVAGAAQAQILREDRTREKKSDWEEEQEKRDWKEGSVTLPAYPKNGDLLEFTIGVATRFRFYIDSKSLVPGPDGVVRYTLVARSPEGVDNISYEGMRCATNSYRVYAMGSDGRWLPKETEWRDMEPKYIQRWHLELRTNFFCPVRMAIHSTAEGLDALRRGRHPSVDHKTGPWLR